jgi:hypothetical protein
MPDTRQPSGKTRAVELVLQMLSDGRTPTTGKGWRTRIAAEIAGSTGLTVGTVRNAIREELREWERRNQ